MKIAFLINNAYGIGGTIRSTLNLSAAFAVRHDVEVVSVHRVQDEPALPVDPRVRLTSLIDMRENSPTYEGHHELTRQPCTMFPDTGAAAASKRLPYSALQDQRIGEYLAHTDAQVVIGTRPDLNGYLARDGQARYLRIGQEHLSLDAHAARLRGHQNAAIGHLDAFVTVSEADAAQYRAALPETATSILCIPNSVPTPDVTPSSLDTKTIVAAGRLVAVKRYDRLIAAFAKLATEHPDWTLRLYGRGPETARLRAQIESLGLYNQAFLMGPVSPIDTEWAKGSIAAVSSDMESFGMTIVEAMHCGVPVISTDCPHGPGEIIDHGQDGLLVPLTDDADAFAQTLKQLIEDTDLRHRLGAAARAKAATYAPAAIAHRYEALIHDLTPRPSLLTRLRRTLHPSTPHTAPPRPDTSPAPAGDPATRITTHARATPQGGMTVAFDAATLPPGALDLVLRLRRDPAKTEIRLPVPTPAPGTELDIQVTLDGATHCMPEGRWDCYLAPRGTNQRTRLTARLVEQAPLHGLPPFTGPEGVRSWIPYTTADGFLAIRTWLRPAHAEVQHVHIGGQSACVTATLHGSLTPDMPGPQAVITATSRTDAAHDIAIPLDDTDGRTFQFALPYPQFLGHRSTEHDLWDLRLLPRPTARPVPLGRIGGDLADRKKTDVVPAVTLEHPARGTTRAKPFFTINNDLAVSLRDATTA
ncbi:glycosyltransferase [Streptomyces lasiicapitis]|uniref:D-inositol 3-phosphate glycosyltransferase n=1 Tax=Streptomyces lasiicapitis TaxID=1923961 RepID=A0ABQ2MMY0_9ACTN|nr:glycosyltransferase [Streptomyces lasiicapitis]GGO54625.1 glycosyl transferase family 1 [Streptomyces lasiicapitis]